MKTAIGEMYDYVCVQCPYCDYGIQEQWGRVNDYTMPDPEDEFAMDCPQCKKEFLCKIESSIG